MWNLTDLEFYVLWTDHVRDRLPNPFTFTTRAHGSNEFKAELLGTRRALQEKFGGSMAPILDAIWKPDLSVTVIGWSEPDPLRPDSQILALGVRRGDRGYVVKCIVGETYWYDRKYVVSPCDPVRLADAALATLPDIGPGTRGNLALSSSPSEETDQGFRAGSIKDTMTMSVVDRAREFERLPTDGVGEIIVAQGESIYGPRGIKRHELKWRDIQGDGRYVITDQRPPVAVAADKQRTIGLVNSSIASVIRVIKEEREMSWRS